MTRKIEGTPDNPIPINADMTADMIRHEIGAACGRLHGVCTGDGGKVVITISLESPPDDLPWQLRDVEIDAHDLPEVFFVDGRFTEQSIGRHGPLLSMTYDVEVILGGSPAALASEIARDARDEQVMEQRREAERG